MGIYTKLGDSGFASTGNRRMIPKNSPVFQVLGTLDELNSALGVARGKLGSDTVELVKALQREIIAFSGELAGGERFATAARVAGMEQSIDVMMAAAGAFEGFVSPGDTAGGAALDLARTVARRAERELVACKQTGGVSREAMSYLNRLSDWLYALARMTDARGGKTAAPQEHSGGETAELISGGEGGFLEMGLWLCRTVLEKAREMGVAVVTAACDAGGNPVTLLRDDGAYIASVDIAQNKAYTSVSLQMPTEQLAALAAPGGELYGIQQTNQNRIVIFGGGIPLYSGGRLAGGFGVSGGTAEQDTALAHYAGEQYDSKRKGGR